jgi:hypothetical protein
MKNKIINKNGDEIEPIQFVYQKEWIKKYWKDTHLLSTAVSKTHEQEAEKEEAEAVK